LAGGRERGPSGRAGPSPVNLVVRSEHPQGLFADRTRSRALFIRQFSWCAADARTALEVM